MEEKNILNEIKVEWKESLDQENKITSYHTRFDVKITHNKKYMLTTYQCNASYKNDMKKDILYCILMDASAYEYDSNIDDFQREFGYEKASELLKAFNGCKEAYKKIHELFNKEELEQLNDIFQDY